jgi:hypothetical protein
MTLSIHASQGGGRRLVVGGAMVGGGWGQSAEPNGRRRKEVGRLEIGRRTAGHAEEEEDATGGA